VFRNGAAPADSIEKRYPPFKYPEPVQKEVPKQSTSEILEAVSSGFRFERAARRAGESFK
jgi:hypothetical protein